MQVLLWFLAGVGVILGLIVYIVVFNLIAQKVNPDWDDDPDWVIFAPFVLPFSILVLFAAVTLIGKVALAGTI